MAVRVSSRRSTSSGRGSGRRWCRGRRSGWSRPRSSGGSGSSDRGLGAAVAGEVHRGAPAAWLVAGVVRALPRRGGGGRAGPTPPTTSTSSPSTPSPVTCGEDRRLRSRRGLGHDVDMASVSRLTLRLLLVPTTALTDQGYVLFRLRLRGGSHASDSGSAVSAGTARGGVPRRRARGRAPGPPPE